MKIINTCLILCLGFCTGQEGYENNANIPLDNIGLLHDIFGTGSSDYEGQVEDSQPNSGPSQSFGVQPDVVRPDVPGSQFSGNLVEEQRPASVSVDGRESQCSSYARLGYECVEYYQCRDGHIITDGEGLIDIRFGATPAQDSAILDPSISKCPGQLEVCCKDPDHVAPPAAIRHQPQCGTRHQNGLFANVQNQGKSDTQFGEWPHMCAILEEREVPTPYGGLELITEYKCGGSLISAGVVLTAAHCISSVDPSTMIVRCGEWDTQQENEVLAHQDRRVDSTVLHPGYIASNLYNDLGLVFLSQDMDLTANVDTMCLPQQGERMDNTNCVATGWGKDRFGDEGEYQTLLQQVTLPVVQHSYCQQSLSKNRLGNKFQLHSSFTCAGGLGGDDTCTGDGGSPLVCPSQSRPGQFVQAGIVSWGLGCGQDGVPGVYADVDSAMCWVDWEVSCALGLSYSYFGRSDCAGWVEEQKRDKYVGGYYSGKCGTVYGDTRGQQVVQETLGTGY
eukprot:GFUD01036470.1.p1 GENE.GFUD01036470.1~~GFUD01036470.1.p1  ORF type:complete len:505 (-),score=163.46 GFUD01036470.1:70-1584(-)